jgi:hypothetical protein
MNYWRSCESMMIFSYERAASGVCRSSSSLGCVLTIAAASSLPVDRGNLYCNSQLAAAARAASEPSFG